MVSPMAAVGGCHAFGKKRRGEIGHAGRYQMTARRAPLLASIALFLVACATQQSVVLTPQEQYEPESVTVPPMTPTTDTSPIEPVEPGGAPALPAAWRQRLAVTPSPLHEPPARIAALVPTPPAPVEPTDDPQLLALPADLQR